MTPLYRRGPGSRPNSPSIARPWRRPQHAIGIHCDEGVQSGHMLRALQQCAHVAFSGDAPGAKCHNRIQRCPFALIVCQLAIGFADHTGLHDRIQGLASLDAPPPPQLTGVVL